MPSKIRAGRPRGLPIAPHVLDREQAVVKLRRQGLTWDLIGKEVGLSAPGARAAFLRANQRVIREDVEELRKIEQDRLDLAQNAIWDKVVLGDTTAINTLIRLMERRAKLLGLDQPIKIQAEVVTYDADGITAELARIVQHANSGTALPMAELESPPNPAT